MGLERTRIYGNFGDGEDGVLRDVEMHGKPVLYLSEPT